ncbi:MAG: hypothetical protein V3V14_08990, partial [Saprospiraceae bacterium]
MKTSLLLKKAIWRSLAFLFILSLMSTQSIGQIVLCDWEPGGITPQNFGAFSTGNPDGQPEIIANPEMGGINTSATAFTMCKTSAADPWGGAFFDIDTITPALTFPADGDLILCIDIMMPQDGVVSLKIEGGATDDDEADFLRTPYTGNGAWEQVCFDFTGSKLVGGTYARFTVFPDREMKPVDEDCYMFDNFIMQEAASGPADEVLCDWEPSGITPQNFGAFSTGNPDGQPEIIANPDMGGINTSATVFKMCKTSAADPWGGAFFDIDTITPALTFPSEGELVLCIDIVMPQDGVVSLKIEGGATDDDEADFLRSPYTGNGAWEQVCFDFTGSKLVGGTYARFTVFPDREMKPVDEDCYMFDNLIKKAPSTTISIEGLVCDWEENGITPDQHGVFSDGNPTDTINGTVDNPNPSGINTSARVGKMCKTSSAAAWGGIWFDIDTTAGAVALLNGKSFVCLQVMMPQNGVVALKLESGTTAEAKDASLRSDYNG